MSWSVLACVVEKDAWGPSKDDLTRVESSHPAIEAFAQAADRIRQEAGRVDGSLAGGSLCLKAAGKSLCKAMGSDALWWSGDWWPAQIKEAALKADWSFIVPDDEAADKAAAQAFLNLCAEHNLGMTFG